MADARAECVTCTALAAAGVTTRERELSPPELVALEHVVSPRAAVSELRRCPGCGTLYRTRHHYEFLVGGSYDEDFVRRLDDVEQTVIARVLGERERRDELLAVALRHPADGVRELATLVFWGCACAGENLPQAVRAACEGRPDPEHTGKAQSHAGLLAYGERGPEERALVERGVADAKAMGLEHRYARSLLSLLARRSR